MKYIFNLFHKNKQKEKKENQTTIINHLLKEQIFKMIPSQQCIDQQHHISELVDILTKYR